MKGRALNSMEVKYIDVKQFAAEVGQSFQSIYKHIKSGKLDNYLSKVNGKLYIDREAIELFNPNSQVNENENSEATIRKVERKSELFEELQIQLANERENHLSTTHQLSLLEVEKANLLKQMDDNQREIVRLQKELDEARTEIKRKDELLEATTARVLTMAEKQQELLRNTQLLQAQAQQRQGFFARLFAPKENNKGV